ncbi:hypothetical protein AKJ37_07810 [candidate division MSBL1 archaeon SCGC-AAA259I09]|uniref:Uncharacterized protein n=3 Tax=candidate division MSBL1 TaxID=215777 RepID=A0A133UJ77_9EURY|nr:hypothetical protein AKJ61_03980 [candidate division MSBL1 archaeon SCGC-AAA259B11]KXA94237.1 hypothetical protein AKJ37_07810 [candidate division MSBL1 archaeon SCGC-AAA259I09]KXA94271.1 hypothetical protein AKJ36_03185 [candidate division MSBL1 archaeon SCGC-AAA259I07]
MKEMMEKGSEKGGHSISVRKVGDETTVDVSGDVSDEEINRLKEKYPDAEIRVEGKSTEKKEEEPMIEVIEEEESK